MSIEDTIGKLTTRLENANAREAARIRTRIEELKKLRQEPDDH